MKKFWLMKSEPDVFSFDDLLKAKGRTTHWEGVRNYQARNFMRDEFKLGDEVLYYHSNTEVPAIMGVAEVARQGYEDKFALDSKSDYYDEDAKKKGKNPWIMVDVRATRRFKTPVTREALQKNPKLQKMMVLAKGSRLSVQPVTAEEFRAVLKMGKPESI